jgi:hypothetical protein
VITKTIITNKGKTVKDIVTTESGDIYEIGNDATRFRFNKLRIMSELQPGKRYKISGYGLEIETLGWYKTITALELIP